MIKNLDEINKPSKGTELLQGLKETPKVEDVSTIIQPLKVEEKSPVVPERTKEDAYRSMIKDGVEVVDVKAIEKKFKKKPKGIVDKFGIPINPGEHRNFDRI